MDRLTREELLAEWLHTWTRHGGDVCLGAPIFGMTTGALQRRFHRMKRDGFDIPMRKTKENAA